jgi:hypothetical protein
MVTTATPGTRAPTRPSRGVRRGGYLAAAALNAILIWLLLVAPGWERLTFLTEDFASLTGPVTASLLAGGLVNLVYVLVDPPWVKRLGDATTAAFACVALARTWSVFPFDVADGWVTVLRPFVGFLTVVTAISVLANLALLLRSTLGAAPPEERG